MSDYLTYHVISRVIILLILWFHVYLLDSSCCFTCNYLTHHGVSRVITWLILWFKVILHQCWVKNICPWKFNLEYGGTFTKLFIHVSSRNMLPTTRNLQIRVHIYRPRHYCGDWLTFGCFVPMIADHDLVQKSFGPMIADHDLVKKKNEQSWMLM